MPTTGIERHRRRQAKSRPSTARAWDTTRTFSLLYLLRPDTFSSLLLPHGLRHRISPAYRFLTQKANVGAKRSEGPSARAVSLIHQGDLIAGEHSIVTLPIPDSITLTGDTRMPQAGTAVSPDRLGHSKARLHSKANLQSLRRRWHQQ